MPITLRDDSNLEAQSTPPVVRTEVKQRRRMLLAFAVLLMAVVIVFIKDRELWFSSSSEPDTSNQSAAVTAPGPPPPIPASESVTPATAAPSTPSTVKKPSTSRASSAKDSHTSPPPMISATDRAVLPPLEVEVVAGNQRLPLAASNSSVKVDMQPGTVASAGQANAPASVPSGDSDAHVSLSPNISERVTRPVQPDYPLLAKQMKVQGAVVLQALIDKAGHIEDLRVVSGPTILAAAAREAVKQWQFKPYYQSGQAVETEARITVNFTISTY
jgi:periplasmic protein TonB